MKCTFEMRNNMNCMVVKLDRERVNGFVYPMLINNTLPGIITPVWERQGDGCIALVYGIGNMVSLASLINSGAERHTFYAIYENIERLWNVMDAYMIPDRCCIWNPDYMFVDPRSGSLGIICVAADVYISEPLNRSMFMFGLEKMTGCYRENGTVPGIREDDDMKTTVLCAADCGRVAWPVVAENNKTKTSKRQKKRNDKDMQKKIKKQEKEKHRNIMKEKKLAKKRARKEPWLAYRIPDSNSTF